MDIPRSKFKIGRLVITPDALAAVTESGDSPLQLVSRHVLGDWGCLCDEDKRLNDEAVKDGSRIFSAYLLKDGKTKVWVITEADRSSTCILMPENY